MKKLSIIIVSSLMMSCGESEVEDGDFVVSADRPTEEISDPFATELDKAPDRAAYIDDRIAAEVNVVFSKKLSGVVYAELNDTNYNVFTYEGQLMKASGHPEGFQLRFTPYSYWDDDLEMEVKSKHSNNLEIILTKAQNDVLGYIDYTKETKNLAWDYYENLFSVTYFQKDKKFYPMKFENLGKTEWDG